MTDPKQPRGCLPTVLVLVAMLGIVGLGGVASAAVADLPDLPVNVSRGVTISPPAGWEFAGRSDDGAGILLTSGFASAYVWTVDGSDEREPLEALKAEWSVEPLLVLGEVESIDIRPGLPAARFVYSGSIAEVASAIEGEVIALRGTGYVVLFDAWAGLGGYLQARAEIEQMIDGAVLP
jgi:hypothetical protein